MSAPEPPEALSTDSIEDRFLAALQVRPFPVAELLEMLVVLQACGQTQRRDDCVMVLQETFADNGERDGLIRLFELRADWSGDRPATGTEFRDLLSRAMSGRLGQAQLDSVEFGTLPPRESLRRLQVLLACRPGAFCLDRTWGFGVVRAVDDFYRRLTVDFDRRAGHAMTFAYAGEVLKLLDAQHLLAVRHAEPARFEALVREDPAEAVRMAIRSLGPMSAIRLEEEFRAHGLLPADLDWKRFWSTARAALKRDPLVKVPPANRKSETIELLTRAVTLGDAAWFGDLAHQRDVETLLTRIAALCADKTAAPDEAARAILADRLAFAFRAAETGRDQTTKARTLILATELGLEALDLAGWRAEACTPEFAAQACLKLPAREIERLVALIPLESDLPTALPFVDALGDLPYALADAVLPPLLQGVASTEARQAIREEFTAGEVPPALLLWLTRRQSDPDVQALAGAAAVATQCLVALDGVETGERLRLQHQIARRFEDFGWLRGLLDRMSEVERQALFERVHACEDAWEPPTKRSILGQMLKWFPDLTERQARSDRDVAAGAGAPRLTSWRSYRERAEQHRKLVEEDLPANSRDIAVARSYGDLRENFEYQAAKDAQRLLLQRQAALDADIKSMKGTDFAGVAADRVRMGTAVSVRLADGGTARYYILGEWDSDEALGILPNRSRIAESLEGHRPGDTVSLPVESGVLDAEIVAVEPLPPEILAWAMGR